MTGWKNSTTASDLKVRIPSTEAPANKPKQRGNPFRNPLHTQKQKNKPMKKLILTTLLLCLTGTADAQTTGTAIAIIYDTSGSMIEPTLTADNKAEPKFRVANGALKHIIDKIDAFAKTYPVEATLITFQGTPAPLGKWNRTPFDKWVDNFKSPDGNTPLGEAIKTASATLRKSQMAKKHLVILTDGKANGYYHPETILHENKERDGKNAPQAYLIAFDTNAAQFSPIKQEGAIILSATGKTLDTGLSTLFNEKILLENEE